jgi:outer membrane immunogenic protein
MKNILFGSVALMIAAVSSALAADIPAPVYKAPVAAPSPANDWSGFYFGVSAGYGFGGGTTGAISGDPNIGETLIAGRPPLIGTDVPSALSTDTKGLIAGGQIGYNYRLGAVVVGLEADLSGVNWEGNASAIGVSTDVFGNVFGPFQTALQKQIDWLGTARGRVGFLPVEKLLIYATGGVAFGRTSVSLATGSTGVGVSFFTAPSRLNCAGGSACLAGSSSGTSVGSVVGSGFEYAITDRVSFKSEYLYVDLGHRSVTATGTQPVTTPDVFLTTRVSFKEQIVRAGVNIQFH